MQMFRGFVGWLFLCLLIAGFPALSRGADLPANVVAQYHFVGATPLNQNPNIADAKKVFALRTTTGLKTMILIRMTKQLALAWHCHTNIEAFRALRPLLDEGLDNESLASFGGPTNEPINYVFAAHLGASRVQLLLQNLQAIVPGKVEDLQVESFSGKQWNKGAKDELWMIPAKDWLVFGRGEALAPARAGYLQAIQKTGRPAPALEANVLEADVDWNGVDHWFSLATCPLKLGTMHLALSAPKNGFHMLAKVEYPEAIDWQPQPMSFPTNQVHDPLASFVTGQNVEPFLKSDETLSRLPTNPFRDQFYFWSMSQIAFQNYFAWPANDPSNMMQTLSAQALDEFNPILQRLNNTELVWRPKSSSLVWLKLQMIAPTLMPLPPARGHFILGAFFPPATKNKPAPEALWAQIQAQTNLVYYDWELTGTRVKQYLTLSQMLPILDVLGVGPGGQTNEWVTTAAAAPGGQKQEGRRIDPRLDMEEIWLSGLTGYLGNTITEVLKTGPKEVTIVRNSPFVFDSLELLLLCHWLTDTPAGPLDWHLLPEAKMSGPGLRSLKH